MQPTVRGAPCCITFTPSPPDSESLPLLLLLPLPRPRLFPDSESWLAPAVLASWLIMGAALAAARRWDRRWLSCWWSARPSLAGDSEAPVEKERPLNYSAGYRRCLLQAISVTNRPYLAGPNCQLCQPWLLLRLLPLFHALSSFTCPFLLHLWGPELLINPRSQESRPTKCLHEPGIAHRG